MRIVTELVKPKVEAMRITIFATVMLLAFLLPACGQQQTSVLWGQRGEKYDPAGLLPDFSFAGYERGEKPIPERPPEVSIKSFGAVGDGKTDDTDAFKRALKEAAGKVIGIPVGRYVLSDVVEITASNTVLKGAGSDKTILVFTKPLQTLRPSSAKTGEGKTTTAWSWSGGLVWFKDPSPVKEVLAQVAAPSAKRGETSVTVDSVTKLSVGQEVVIEARDPADGSFVRYLFHNNPQDSAKLIGKLSYRYLARVKGIKEKIVVLDRPLRFDFRPEWSGVLRGFTPTVHHSGIEDLAFEFPQQPYRGHWQEDGFNAIIFENCVHCWARRFVIRNSDSGVFLTRSFFCTVSDVCFTANRRAEVNGHTGHHGFVVEGTDNLCTRFHFRNRFFHELTLSHTSIGNVFSDGDGEDLTLDHHKHGVYENLFTNLDAGVGGPHMWTSGGASGVGPHTAAGATFWNIRSKERSGLPSPGFGPSGLIFVGLKGILRKSEIQHGWHYEPINAGSLTPPNLHLAQLARRLATDGASPASAAMLRWTTMAGQAFNAKCGGLSGVNVIFILQDGRRAPYPFASLSAESRALVTKLAKSDKHEESGEVSRVDLKTSGAPSQTRETSATPKVTPMLENTVPAEEQIRRFVEKMKELNPDFDGHVTPTIDRGTVVELAFSTKDVRNISPVRTFSTLTKLVCTGNGTERPPRAAVGKLDDLSPLQGMSLQQLNIAGNEISDLSPLRGMSLQRLVCFHTKVGDLSALRGMKLVQLQCHATKVRDLSPLQGMPLTFLHCGFTDVSDLSPLKGMPLTSLACGKAHVTDLSLIKGMPLKILLCDFEPERDSKLLHSIETLETINYLPIKEFWKRVEAGESPQPK